MSAITVTPIGIIRCTRHEPTDDHWSSERTTLELDASQFSPAALAGLDTFSHLEVVYLFHGVAPGDVELRARHPRNNPAWPEVGIFAQRAKRRPNRLGVSRCAIESIDGLRIEVTDLDAIDGTPLLDIKPWVTEFGPRGETHQPAWMTELMREYH